jgi:hypothetical protein
MTPVQVTPFCRTSWATSGERPSARRRLPGDADEEEPEVSATAALARAFCEIRWQEHSNLCSYNNIVKGGLFLS